MNAPTPDPIQPVIPPAAWYTSPVQVNLVAAGISQGISLIFRTIELFGFEIQAGKLDIDAIGANLAQGLAGGFLAYAWWKRQRSTLAPLTMTKRQAEDMTAINPPMLASDPTKVPKV